MRMSLPVKMRVALDVAVIAVFAVAAYVSLDWQLRARIMPLTVSVFGMLLGVSNLVVDLRRWSKVGFAFINVDRGKTADLPDSKEEASAREGRNIRLGLRYFGWILLFSGLMYVAGAMVGAVIFLVGFLKVEGHYSWKFIAGAVVGVLIGIWAAEHLLDLRLPKNLLDL